VAKSQKTSFFFSFSTMDWKHYPVKIVCCGQAVEPDADVDCWLSLKCQKCAKVHMVCWICGSDPIKSNSKKTHHLNSANHQDAVRRMMKKKTEEVVSPDPSTISQTCRNLLTRKSDAYFHHEADAPMNGCHFLAGSGLCKKGFEPMTQIPKVDTEEALLDARIACLMNSLPRTKGKELAEINWGLYQLGQKHKEEDLGNKTQNLVAKTNSFLEKKLAGLLDHRAWNKRPCEGDEEHAERIKRTRKEEVRSLLDGTMEVMKRNMPTMATKEPDKKRLIPAKNFPDSRPRYMRGKHSYLECIPQPGVWDNKAESHAVVSIEDCIRDAYAHGFPMEVITAESIQSAGEGVYEWITETPRAKEIWMDLADDSLDGEKPDSPPLEILPIVFWSDDCEPNSSIGKSNRGSAHLITVTLGMTRCLRNSLKHTYPASVSGKNVTHEPACECFHAEISKINERGIEVYSKARGGAVRVKVGVFARLADQPERRGENGLMGGKGRDHVRFRFSADHQSLSNVLPPCAECYDSLFTRGVLPGSNGPCSSCLCWDVNPRKNGDLLAFLPPRDYPKEFPDNPPYEYQRDSQQRVKPFEMTCERLSFSAKYAHNMLEGGHWNLKETEAFLRRENFNKKLFDRIALSARLCRLDPAAHPARLPCLWSKGEILALFVDVIMHVLFLGVMKTTMLHIQVFLSQEGCNSLFVRIARSPGGMNDIMDSKQLRSLSWLCLAEYRGEKFGGWVSENYLAFSRMCLWFYQNLPEVCQEGENAAAATDDTPPMDRPPEKWTAKQLKKWLKDRRMDVSGKKEELLRRMLEALNSDEGPPEVGEPMRERSTDQVLRTLTALQDMLAEVMTTEVNSKTEEKMELQIKNSSRNLICWINPLGIQKIP
jgi:hypothetical protein